MKRRLHSIVLAAALVVGLGCGRSDAPTETKAEPAKVEPSAAATPTAAAPHPRLAPRAPRALTAPHMPEDPVLAARTTAATEERRAKKKYKRFLTFDHENISVHRALLAQIASARARYDRASDEAGLSAARAGMPAQLEKMKEGLAKLDARGIGSRLLPDYEALQTALTISYPDAKLASLRGDKSALTAEQASFDQRLHAMEQWLEQAKAASPEAEAQAKK
jgi:hypothetical protein